MHVFTGISTREFYIYSTFSGEERLRTGLLSPCARHFRLGLSNLFAFRVATAIHTASVLEANSLAEEIVFETEILNQWPDSFSSSISKLIVTDPS